MKPIIFIVFLFACFCVRAQNKFVQAAYTYEIEYDGYIGRLYRDNYRMYIYNDTSVTLELIVTQFALTGDQSFNHTFFAKGTLANDTLSIIYNSFTAKFKASKKMLLKENYIPGDNERLFFPPSIFIVGDNQISDLNSDFPTLKKVSPALAMNIPLPK